MKKSILSLIKGRTGALAENEAKDLLRAYGISTTKYTLIEDEKDIDSLRLRYPVALKVCSSRILHKTDVNGVKLDIKDKQELKKMLHDFKKRFPEEKFLVDEMAKKGAEFIVGLIQDQTFGLSIMCGVGGVFTELYKDVSFRVVPIDRYDAEQMIEELKGKKLLEGFRNIKADKKHLIDLILRVSELGSELVDYIDQMDLNPVFVYSNGVCVVDAKVILK
jgi:acyl-CoA synthetase (NDP forming)